MSDAPRFWGLYLLPNIAKVAIERGEVRLQDYGVTWKFMSLRVGEPVDVDAYMRKIGVVGFRRPTFAPDNAR